MTPYISPCHLNCNSSWVHSPARTIKKRVRYVLDKINPIILSCHYTQFSSTFTQGKAQCKVGVFNIPMHTNRNTYMHIFWFKQSRPSSYWDQICQILGFTMLYLPGSWTHRHPLVPTHSHTLTKSQGIWTWIVSREILNRLFGVDNLHLGVCVWCHYYLFYHYIINSTKSEFWHYTDSVCITFHHISEQW